MDLHKKIIEEFIRAMNVGNSVSTDKWDISYFEDVKNQHTYPKKPTCGFPGEFSQQCLNLTLGDPKNC